MAFKEFKLDEQLSIKIYKRRGSRNVRLSVGAGGNVRVSIPYWAPYTAGLQFAKSRRQWIDSQRKPAGSLKPGQLIGKAHRLHFTTAPTTKVMTRVYPTQIVISHPFDHSFDMDAVQVAAEAAGVRALRSQARQLLPQRLETLADQHGFKYRSVRIKQMRSRWGSCDRQGNIVLNLFLMQLPWQFIDYVLVHELVHTKILRHGPDFWREMVAVMPDVQARRKAVKQYQPILHGSEAGPVA